MTSNTVVTDPTPATGTPPPVAPALPSPRALTLLFVVVLYLVTFGRWGSHIGVPGLPLFVGDIGVAAALGHTAVALKRQRLGLREAAAVANQVHLALLLTVALLAWSVLRALLGATAIASEPLAALRDLAPYGYAIVAVAAFLLPAAGSTRLRRAIYAGLTVHLVWMVAAPWLPGWPRRWPQLGDAAIFTTRPDFDAAVVGIAVALALYELLAGGRGRSRREVALLVGFAAANAGVLATSPTRAGLLSGLTTIISVLVISALAGRERWMRSPGARRRAGGVLVVVLLAIVAAIAFTPAGQRLVGLGDGENTGLGTLQAREYTWSGVSRYLLADAPRTAMGVGFGADFVTDSGTSFALEGTEYKDVRSPHNYLLGTVARLGVAGGLLAAFMLGAAAFLAVGLLRRGTDTVTALAALLVLGLPVTALLGVILESPFGAIPYFWAVGHLARRRWELDTAAAARTP